MYDMKKTKKHLIDELNILRRKLSKLDSSPNLVATTNRDVKLVKEKIVKGEAGTRQILRTIPSGLIIVDQNRKITYTNKEFERIVGLKSEHIIGKECLLYFGCVQCKEGCELYDKSVTKPFYSKECVIYVKGQEKTLLKNVEILKDPDGNIIGGLESFNDITILKQAEKALRESEQKHRTLFETMTQGVFYQDSDGKIITANPAAERILGLTFEQVKGKDPAKFQWNVIQKNGTNIRGDKYPSTVVLKTGEPVYDTRLGIFNPIENQFRWLNINAVPQFRSGEKKPYQVYTTMKDITDQIKTEILLRDERDRAQKYLDIAGVMFVAINEKGIITLINRRVCKILGYTQIDIIGKNWFDNFLPAKMRVEVKKVFKKLMKGEIEPAEYYENSVITKNGEEKIIAWHNTILNDDNKKIIGTLSSGEDITEQKKAEEQIQLDLNEKKILLREIHHRVKNNMQIIISLLNLQSHELDDKRTKIFLDECRGRIRSMALVHEQLYVSDNIAKINCTKYLESLVRNVFHSFKIDPSKISIEIKLMDVPIGIDQAIPCGLIVNELISNSLKYAYPKSKKGTGKINVSCKGNNNNEIQLIIQDDGIGIPENIDIYNTDTLGLHLVKILAEEQLHGKFKMQRRNGTRFCIEFPAFGK